MLVKLTGKNRGRIQDGMNHSTANWDIPGFVVIDVLIRRAARVVGVHQLAALAS